MALRDGVEEVEEQSGLVIVIVVLVDEVWFGFMIEIIETWCLKLECECLEFGVSYRIVENLCQSSAFD